MARQKRFGSPRCKYTMIARTCWRSMMRKFSWMLLVLLVFSVYAEDEKEKEVDSVYADIIYLEREIVVGLVSVENSDIVYLKNGRQIKGRIVERSPQQVKIEVTSESKKKY